MSQSRPDQPLPDDAAFRYPMADTLDIGGFSMSSFGPDTVLTLHENTSFQPLGDGEGGVLLDTQSGQLFTCNDTTAAFLSAVDGTRNFAGILGELEKIFEVDAAVLHDDMAELAGQLADEGLIVRVDP
jgi:hypothetical protein